MHSTKKKLYCYAAAVGILSLLGFFARMLSLLYDYEPEIGYYRENGSYVFLFSLASLLTILLAFSALLLFRKDFRMLPETFSTDMCKPRLSSAYAATLGIILLLLPVFTAGKELPYLLLALPFLLLWLLPGLTAGGIHAITVFPAIAFLIRRMSISYFDPYVPMNHPGKILLEVAATTAVFYLLSEIRIFLSKTKPGLYLFSLTLVIFFSLSSSIPGIYLYFSELYPKDAFFSKTSMLCDAFFALSLLLLALVRLFQLIHALTREPEEEIREAVEEIESTEESGESGESEESEESGEIGETAEAEGSETAEEALESEFSEEECDPEMHTNADEEPESEGAEEASSAEALAEDRVLGTAPEEIIPEETKTEAPPCEQAAVTEARSAEEPIGKREEL